MTERELNNVFAKFVSSQLFDCMDADTEIAAKNFVYLSGADDFRIELIKYMKENGHM